MRVVPFIWDAVRPYRRFIVGVVAATLFYTICAACRPYFIRELTNSAVTGGVTPEAMSVLWRIVGLFIVVQITLSTTRRSLEWCLAQFEPPLKTHIAALCFRYVLNHEYRYFQGTLAGSLATRIDEVAKAVQMMVQIILNHYLYNFLIVIIAASMLAQVSGWFTLALLVWATTFTLLAIGMVGNITRLACVSADAAAHTVGVLVDSLSNIQSIRLLNGRDTEQLQLHKAHEVYLAAAHKRRRAVILFYSVLAASYALYQACCLWLLVTLFGKGLVRAGDFALILSTNMWILDNMWEMASNLQKFTEYWGIVERSLTVLFAPQPPQLPAVEASHLTVTKGEIIFENVSFEYPGSPAFFKNLSVRIAPGEKIGLAGYSGAGKTTFINLLLRLYEVTSGRILIDGVDISSVPQEELREHVGVIPQDTSLFNRTIRENIAYSKPGASDQEIEKAARAAHAHDFIMRQEGGYNAPVGERGGRLSGGQRQRIGVARAFLKNAPILVLDEATSQLDTVTEVAIQDSLETLMAGKTTLAIAHRFSTLMQMDRIFVFDAGKIVAVGTHAELLAQQGLYADLWAAHQASGMAILEEDGEAV